MRENTGRSFDVLSFARAPEAFAWIKDTDWIINCVGLLRQDCVSADMHAGGEAILVNALFPHLLASFLERTSVRVLQIATDGVFSGQRGAYNEADAHDALDLYGRTKSLGEVPSRAFLHIRCSIIGPDPKRRRGLLDWILSHPPGAAVRGFVHHRWNGVTTLQFAKLCDCIISQDSLFEDLTARSAIHHFVPNETLTKHELLERVNQVYRANLRIEAVSEPGPPQDRSLTSRFELLQQRCGAGSLQAALEELRIFSGSGRLTT
jgi:dTDP-4-dehydrorhamnose reductase